MRCRAPCNAPFALLSVAALLAAGLVRGQGAGADAEQRGAEVLVLGSGGLVGRTLVKWLEERDFTVHHVRNRRHIDLRVPGALDIFNSTKLSYVFFLACEVGGSKFIENSARDLQIGIIESNIRMYQVVFPWLAARKIPFVFTSSYLQGTANPYGVIKRLGEQWIHNLGTEEAGLGRTLRLWNVYGAENVGLKSHVLSDWSEQCVRQGYATARTDGREERQFIHALDVAEALGAAMQHHASLPPESDVSTGTWNDMRVLAGDLLDASKDVLGVACKVQFSEVPAGHRERLSPIFEGNLHRVWKAGISLKMGCKLLLEEYRMRKEVCQRRAAAGGGHEGARERGKHASGRGNEAPIEGLEMDCGEQAPEDQDAAARSELR